MGLTRLGRLEVFCVCPPAEFRRQFRPSYGIANIWCSDAERIEIRLNGRDLSH